MLRPLAGCISLFSSLLLGIAAAQVSPGKEKVKTDYLDEGAVIEESNVRAAFNADGTSTRTQETRVRIQSEAGVQQYGLLNFPYQGSVEHIEITYVRVRKSNGSVVTTPEDNIQEMPSEVSRQAPFYSDLREKHVAVKGLEPGTTLEYAASWVEDKPLAPSQFWFAWQFTKSAAVISEQLEVSAPVGKQIKIKSQTVQPTVREEAGRRIYSWKTSNSTSETKASEKKDRSYQLVRGLLPPPDVLVSSFQNWEEVGRWYSTLQEEKVKPSPDVQAKAAELTKGLTDDQARIQAIYDYVSLHYRYIGIAFGIGRYQPHSADQILGNQYGDCKDKHTLLAALLAAAGIKVYPALINVSRAVDPDVPSPGQFDHVITFVPSMKQTQWMDSTAEVGPLGFLLLPLRDKPALVITPDKIAFQTTPAVPPFNTKKEYTLSAQLATEGTLTAQVKSWERGDSEFFTRAAFRHVPQSQYKELMERISYAATLGGTITDVSTSSPDALEVPFALNYSYTLKDFYDGDKRRFTLPFPPMPLPGVKDEDLDRTTPMWLGTPGEELDQVSRIEMPKGMIPAVPEAVTLKEDFAEYQSSSVIENGTLVSKRHLVIKRRELDPSQVKKYKAFHNAITDDVDRYFMLASTSSTQATAPNGERDLLARTFKELPASTNAEAVQAEKDGWIAAQRGQLRDAVNELKRAVELDPQFTRAWIGLGAMYMGIRDKQSGIEALQRAVNLDPKKVLPSKVLAFTYTDEGRRKDAIAVWERLFAIAPDDHDVPTNLGMLYMAEKRYPEAARMFDLAAKAFPKSAFWQVQLGSALIKSGDKEKGIAAMKRALEFDSGAEMLNDVGYEMADNNVNYSEALGYSLASLQKLEEASQRVNLEDVKKEDLARPMEFGAYWDTYGWIEYKMGNFPVAENYLNAAWQLRQGSVIAEHLGEVYEKEQKPQAAMHIYNLALEVDPKLEEVAERMRKLAHVPLPAHRLSARDELNQMRTFKLPKLMPGEASADFFVLFGAGGKIQKAAFFRGSELLRNADDELVKSSIKIVVPEDSHALILRKGALSCSPDVGCSFSRANRGCEIPIP
jgi:tetratricopeptide (TPR) repeat protein